MSPDLPPALAVLVGRATAARGLTRAERVDVARELTAHFAEGLAAGVSADRLAAGFGDPAVAARLIARARRRTRPAAVRWLVRSIQAAAAAALVMYGVSAVRLHTGAPARPADPARAAFVALLTPEHDGPRDLATLRAAFDDLFARLYAPGGRRLTAEGLAMIRTYRGKPDLGPAARIVEPLYFAFPAPRDGLAAELNAILRPVAAAMAAAGPDSAAAALRADVAARMRSPLWQLRYFPLAALLPLIPDWLAGPTRRPGPAAHRSSVDDRRPEFPETS